MGLTIVTATGTAADSTIVYKQSVFMLATLLVQYNPDGSLVYQNPYLNTQLVMGRQPFQYVEIDLDYCANTAGVAPCTALQTGDAKCFNTYATCNDG